METFVLISITGNYFIMIKMPLLNSIGVFLFFEKRLVKISKNSVY